MSRRFPRGLVIFCTGNLFFLYINFGKNINFTSLSQGTCPGDFRMTLSFLCKFRGKNHVHEPRRAQNGRNLTKLLPFVTSVTLSNTYVTHVNSVTFVTSLLLEFVICEIFISLKTLVIFVTML
jgi:hypothetical protein